MVLFLSLLFWIWAIEICILDGMLIERYHERIQSCLYNIEKIPHVSSRNQWWINSPPRSRSSQNKFEPLVHCRESNITSLSPRLRDPFLSFVFWKSRAAVERVFSRLGSRMCIRHSQKHADEKHTLRELLLASLYLYCR